MRELKDEAWHPGSWQNFPAFQMPTYPVQKQLEVATHYLQQQVGLIKHSEIIALKKQLARVVKGEYFLLQGGDCAESIEHANFGTTQQKVDHLKQLASIIQQNSGMPCVLVGRLAGQYAKPRSNDYELVNNQLLPVYRGDMVNHYQAIRAKRIPDPQLLIKAYQQSAKIIRQLTRIRKNCAGSATPVFVSHEALLLFYEEALTRVSESDQRWYNLATHFPWVGMRTSALGQAHIEYIRGIANPVALKVGPNFDSKMLYNTILTLTKNNFPGKLTLIYRFGAKNISEQLPRLFNAIAAKTRRNIIFCCDPMHGNTEAFENNKFRAMENILHELELAFTTHKQHHIKLNGIHLEMTHESVIECIKQNEVTRLSQYKKHYKSLVDPRLNLQQSIQVVNLVAHHLASFAMRRVYR